MTRRSLIVFGRTPRPGKVKTRLIPALGEAGATAVYRRLLQAALRAGRDCDCDRRELWLEGPLTPAMRELANRFGFGLRHQPSGDLGARMAGALASTLSAPGGHAVLIGSDCPAFDGRYLNDAFAALDSVPAVVGPASDGGYLLIGMNRAEPGLFHGMAWSTPRVLDETRQRLRALCGHWHELPTLADIDEADDLRHYPGFFGTIEGTKTRASD